MFFAKKCVYLGKKVRESNGKQYVDINVEFENDEVMSLPVAPGIDINGLQKYQPCNAVFELREYNGSKFVKFAGVVHEK